MKMRVMWEKRRADRAQDRIEFLELECRSNCCSSRASSAIDPPAKTTVVRASLNTVFVPAEGVFRTVSPPLESPRTTSAQQMPPPQMIPSAREPVHYTRTPSCEPPSQAVAPDMNTSLLSLLDPQSRGTTPLHANFPSTFTVPTMTIPPNPSPLPPTHHQETPSPAQLPRSSIHEDEEPEHTPSYHTISRTTTIPLSDSSSSNTTTHAHPRPASRTGARTPITNTISREQALAQIRERRGRARSLANGTTTPKKPAVPSSSDASTRRDISAPVGAGTLKGGAAVRGRNGIRA